MAQNNSNPHPQLKQDIRGYELGEIPAEGAFIAELQIGGPPMPLQGIVDHQYQDSQSMSRRPGFYVKYMPFRYDEINGQFHTGGSYLFDTLDNAKKYDDWSSNEFEAGDKKGSFWAQPMWAHSAHWVWNVIGAYNFAPIEEHAIGRLQRWRYEGSDAEAALKDAYPALKAAAKEQGAAAVWLLHQPEEKMIAIQAAYKIKEKDHASAKSSLTAIERQDSLESILSKDLKLASLFDRSSLFLSCWVPRSRELGGTEMAIPNYPLVPAITQMQS